MRTYGLDGGRMTTPEQALRHMAEVLGFPAEEASDLDGLWDCLCEVPVPFHISISHWAKAVRGLEDYADELLEVLCDLVEEEPEFTFDMTD